MEVGPQGDRARRRPHGFDALGHVGGHGDADGVGDGDLVGAGLRHPPGDAGDHPGATSPSYGQPKAVEMVAVTATPSRRAAPATSANTATLSSRVTPWLRRPNVSVATVTTLISLMPALAARSYPLRLSTRPMYVTPSWGSRAATTASASAICGTLAGFTKLATSMRRIPAATALAISSTLMAVASTSGSDWSPSRGATSTREMRGFSGTLPLWRGTVGARAASAGSDGTAAAVVALVWVLIPGAAAVASPHEAPAAPAAPSAVGLVARQEDDGLRYESQSQFVVDAAAAAIHVTVDVTATNETPNQTSSGGVRQFYFHSLTVVTLAEAVNLTATRSDGAALSVSQEPTDVEEFAIAVVDLRPDIFYRQSQSLRLTYDLPSQPPRSPNLTRVNAGFVNVVVIPVGDSGLAGVEVVVPDQYDSTAEGSHGELDREVQPGQVVYRASGIDPTRFDIVVVGRDDDRLASTTFEAADHEIEVRSWPEDGEWATFVETQLTTGLPVLEDLIGQEPAVERPLQIVETVTPYIYGYGGWYQPLRNIIEIGDDLDPLLMLHELSHMWFNNENLSGRWLGEAFAEEYAHRAQAALVDPETVPVPKAVTLDDPGRQPLNEWRDPQTFDELTGQRERYAYNAGWAVLRTISDEIGIDRLGDVTAAILDRTIAYRGDGDPERWGGSTDWRRLLDLVEEIGGSTTAAGAFEAHVVSATQVGDLAERATAREAYAVLEADGSGWAPPVVVRQDMGRWDFEDATDGMEQAHAVLATRDEMDALLDGAGFESPGAFEEAYEEAEDLDRLESEAAVPRRQRDRGGRRRRSGCG